MPRRTIAPENKVGLGGNRFPRLDFKAKGERHRVLLFQKDADGQAVVWQEYVHLLRCPQFGEDGMVKMTLKDSRREEGEKYQDYDLKWIGSPLCLGDSAVIEETGYDPDNCPVCAKITDAPSEANLRPVLQFAANVVDYTLAPNSWQVQKPLSAKVLVWRFNATTYDEIISQQEQHGELLQKQDLTLECVNATYKNVKMGVMSPSGWATVEDGGKYLAQLLGDPANIATEDELRDACGRPAKRVFMEEDLALVLRKWRQALPAAEGDLTAGFQFGGGAQPALAGAVEQLKQQAQAEVAQILNPLAAAGAMAASGLGEFTAEGNHQAAAERAKAAALAAPSSADNPFGAQTAGMPAASSATPGTAEVPFGNAAAGIPGSGSAAATSGAQAAPAGTSPFGSPGGSAPAVTTMTTPVPAAGQTSPTESSPAVPAAPAEGKPVSFDEMIAQFGGLQ